MVGLEQRLALFGLKVRGHTTRRGKESALGEVFSIFSEKDTIEEYVSHFQDGIQKINEEYSAFLRSAVHEVRGINADIYNSSYELEQILSASSNTHPNAVAGNIVRLSELLKIRTDTIDVFSNPASLTTKRTPIPVFKKFDKIVRCLKPSAKAENVNISIKGYSISTTLGIALFDVIPYLAIQNAIKYSPSGCDVDVVVKDEVDQISCSIHSFGPTLEPDELDRVFELGFRGTAAVQHTAEGSGIGLYFLKYLVERIHFGQVKFWQTTKNRFSLDGVDFCPTEVLLVFNKNGR